MEFKGDFILASGTLRYVVQRDLETRVVAHLKGHCSALEIGSTPVPAFNTQLLFQHILLIVV